MEIAAREGNDPWGYGLQVDDETARVDCTVTERNRLPGDVEVPCGADAGRVGDVGARSGACRHKALSDERRERPGDGDRTDLVAPHQLAGGWQAVTGAKPSHLETELRSQAGDTATLGHGG